MFSSRPQGVAQSAETTSNEVTSFSTRMKIQQIFFYIYILFDYINL
jgi:hypothetical protein